MSKVLKMARIFMYLKAEHASEEGEENGHSSDTIEHEGTSAQLFDQKHLKKGQMHTRRQRGKEKN